MQLVERHIIKRNSKEFRLIDELSYKSKNLYNSTLYAIRQNYFNICKQIKNTNDEQQIEVLKKYKYLSYYKLQKQFQDSKQHDYISLSPVVGQQVMRMADQNFKTFFKAYKKYKECPNKFKSIPKIPKYLDSIKGRYILIYTYQAISKKILDKTGYIKPRDLEIYIKTKVTYDKLQQVRIVKSLNSYIIEVIYKINDMSLKLDNNRYKSIDLGLNNLCAVVTNTDLKPYIIDGKKLKSINEYFNYKIAKYKSIAIKRNNLKTTNKIQSLYNKRTNIIENYLHKVSKYIVQSCIDNNINTLIVGYNKLWKSKINLGRNNNRKFVSIPFARLIQMLEYKCKLSGINFQSNEESYTSKCSFIDLENVCKHSIYKGKRVYRGLFRSNKGILINADINGAYNIMRKNKSNVFTNTDDVMRYALYPVVIKTIKNI